MILKDMMRHKVQQRFVMVGLLCAISTENTVMDAVRGAAVGSVQRAAGERTKRILKPRAPGKGGPRREKGSTLWGEKP